MRAWLLPSLLLLCSPVAMATPLDVRLSAPTDIAADCYIPYTGPDETHGNPFGGDEGFFIAVVPAEGREGDEAGSQAGYGVGMTGCEIDPWGDLIGLRLAAP
jgi:hypothetical protein